MSKVVKYYYSSPVFMGTIMVNPINEKTVISKIRQGRRYTMAAVYDDEDKTIKFGLSVCQSVDNFCKKVGRKIAEDNAMTKPFHVIENFTGRRNDFADEVMNVMIEKEKKLLKKDHPNIFNSDYFVN